MVIGYHIILTGYGHWLPNDPRGSMSKEVHAPRISALAELHFGRRETPPTSEELREFYGLANQSLHYPPVWWQQPHRQALCDAFAAAIIESGLTCNACAILRSHVHLLFRKHHLKAEGISAMLRSAGKQLLVQRQLAAPGHPVFSADSCHHFKSRPAQMVETISYIDDNYVKHNLDQPDFVFVTPYDGWPEN